jgi:AcrR family transcriptional regulator
MFELQMLAGSTSMSGEDFGPGSSSRKRSGRRKGQTPDLRHLENIALRAFAKRGFETVGLRELAAAAEIAPALISYRYKSKLGLWKAVVDGLAKRIELTFQAMQRSYQTSGPFPVRARKALRHLVDMNFELPELSRFYMNEMSQSGERQQYALLHLWEPYLAAVLPIIREAGERHDTDMHNTNMGEPEFAAFAILSMIMASQHLAPVLILARAEANPAPAALVMGSLERLLGIDIH